MRLPIHPEHPEPRKIRRAADALRAGEVIAYPTDTVYGLCCALGEKKAVDRIYQLKRMPKDQPLAVVCPDLADIARFAVVDNQTYRLLKRALPGAYTFILQATREVPRILQSKQKTVGIRVPANPVAQALVRELGMPLVSSSAVFQDEVLQDPDEIDDRFRGLAMVLDAGWGGVDPSTVVDISKGDIDVIREGAGPVDVLG